MLQPTHLHLRFAFSSTMAKASSTPESNSPISFRLGLSWNSSCKPGGSRFKNPSYFASGHKASATLRWFLQSSLPSRRQRAAAKDEDWVEKMNKTGQFWAKQPESAILEELGRFAFF